MKKFNWKQYLKKRPDLKKNWNGPVRAWVHYNFFNLFNPLKKYHNSGNVISIHTFPKFKLLYVEVPKAGCTSIKFFLRKEKTSWNMKVNKNNLELFHREFGREKINQNRLKSFIKTKYKNWIIFTVVRNPYDRFVSFYWDKAKGKNISEILKADVLIKDVHSRPQTKIIGKDLKIYDFIGSTEKMNETFAFLSKITGKKTKIVKLNQCSKNKTLNINSKQLEIIKKVYADDFRLLGYDPLDLRKLKITKKCKF